jgi:hypothetical protein
MSEHTKGPWILVDTPAIRDIFNGCSVVAAEGIDDAIIAAIGGDVPEVEANARLIAAAPELLEALKEAHKMLLPSMFGTPEEEVHRLGKLYSSVIAKAEAQHGS